MTPGGDNSAPFPSTGKGRGWGGGTLRQDVAHQALSSARPSPSALPDNHPASTPTQPSPVEGEGYDRLDRETRAAPKVVARARKFRAALTHTEAKLWKHLRALPVRFRRQAPVGPYVVDFTCHRACLVVEVDGGVHNLPEVALRDLQRDEWLAMQGYRVLRFTTKQVEDDIESVLANIRAASPLSLDDKT